MCASVSPVVWWRELTIICRVTLITVSYNVDTMITIAAIFTTTIHIFVIKRYLTTPAVQLYLHQSTSRISVHFQLSKIHTGCHHRHQRHFIPWLSPEVLYTISRTQFHLDIRDDTYACTTVWNNWDMIRPDMNHPGGRNMHMRPVTLQNMLSLYGCNHKLSQNFVRQNHHYIYGERKYILLGGSVNTTFQYQAFR